MGTKEGMREKDEMFNSTSRTYIGGLVPSRRCLSQTHPDRAMTAYRPLTKRGKQGQTGQLGTNQDTLPWTAREGRPSREIPSALSDTQVRLGHK